MCPFSHDIESTTRPAPCKYFAKGGCKFGRKCALLHITQDGTIVNRHYPPPQFLAGPPPPSVGVYGPPPPGLLSMQAKGLEPRANGDNSAEFDNYQYGPRNGFDASQPDMTYTSASPKIGSPSQNDRLATSPKQKGLSVLDAPLPNSFDSNGVSWAAIHGHFAASVPARTMDFDSPPSSLPRKSQHGNTALRNLHNSAFGERGMDNVIASMGSSPPSGVDEPLQFAKRQLHSDRLRASRGMVSASLGTGFVTHRFEDSEEDEEPDTDREEDLLPSSLHDLIPEDRPRRISRSRNIEETHASSFLTAPRRTISGHTADGKVGSPHSGSPSRYSGVFARSAMRDNLGHVGSPLRDSSFPTSHPVGLSASGELSPSINSPPRQASMSMLTQELQRTRIESARSASSSQIPQAPTPTRTLSNGSARASMDRNLSSASISQRIDEEDQEVFNMDLTLDKEPKFGGSSNGLTSGSPARESAFGPVGGGRRTQ